jgi:predicted transcriptional regulator
MLWFDNDPRTELTAKVSRAADYYRQKYGLVPDLCIVHPSMLAERTDLVKGNAGKVTVRSNRAILPGHLWIGNEDKN